MTQKYRWLAALALLLAFGACTVRAEEEEEEVAPRPHLVVELPKMAVMPTAMPSPAFPMLFAPPCPCPCPMPIPAGMYGLPPGPICLPYPCPPGTCSAQCCGARQTEDAPQYVVTTKMVKGDDDDAEVTMCPRVSVFEGQQAILHFPGYQTPQGRSSLEMGVWVTREGKGARLALRVTEAGADDSDESHPRSHTETTQAQCSVPFGKPYKMDLKTDDDGNAVSWMEVTVTEVERETRLNQTACGGGACPASMTRAAEDTDATPLDTVGEVVDCLYDILSDTATSAFGWALGEDDDAEEAPQAYLQTPPQYVPLPPPAQICMPASRVTVQPCSVCGSASCPKGECGCCIQCAAAEAAKKQTLHIRIDAIHGRKSFEMVDSDNNHWKGSADRLTMQDGYMVLEGDGRLETCDGSKKVTGDKIHLKVENMEIQIGD